MQKFKQFLIILSIFDTFLMPNLSYAQCVSDAVLQDASLLTDNSVDITNATVNDWKTFEKAICNSITNTKAAQVSLDIIVANKTYRIVADYLEKVSGGYRVVDCKTSLKKDLATLQDLTPFLTSNQTQVYPAINNGTVTKAKVRGKNGESIGLKDDNSDITIVTGVTFYVNLFVNGSPNFSQYKTRTLKI